MKLAIVFLVAASAISGCATQTSDANLYWGNYSNTLYKVKKSPSESTKTAHEAELLKIVQVSEEKGLRVPPGVFAELAVLSAERGEESESQAYLSKETSLYPEAGTLIDHFSAREQGQ